MNRKLINWLGLLGILALASYTAAVVFSPIAFPGYNWMEQAVSDLSADRVPVREPSSLQRLRRQLSSWDLSRYSC